jgi:Carboxypeptidase regulatory-like domain
MSGILKAIASLMAAVFLLPSTALANEAICKPQKTKKVSRLCVVVINQTGGPQADVRLTVFDGEKQIAEGTTGEDGKFSFDTLEAGSYQVKVHHDGFKDDQFPIVVTNSGKKCKHAVQVLVYVGWIPCTGVVRLIKP